MSAVTVKDRQKERPLDLIINENKRGEVVIAFNGVDGNPWLVKPYDLLTALLEASPSFTSEVAALAKDAILNYYSSHDNLID